MNKRKDDVDFTPALAWLARHWRLITVLAWLGMSGWYIYQRLGPINAFALGDTDDNLRMAQVRALLAGQDWFDLRQYRLAGSNIHWSRLVDLPLAGLILALRPLVGGPDAERIAVAVAPLLPLLPLMFSLALTVRRLVDPSAPAFAFLVLFFAGLTTGMFMPLRIDHHGWQLAFLALAMAGLADPRPARGGATVGLATALSLAVGLELLIYLALAAAATVLFWIDDLEERARLRAYGVTVAGGTAVAFMLFASYANRQAVCDALSPVWLSDALLGGALLFGIAWLSPRNWKVRLLLAAVAGGLVAGFHALAWPHCLSRLEGVSPEVTQLWLSHVREALPVYRHGAQTTAQIVALPITGAVGWALLLWRYRRDRSLARRVLAAATPGIVAGLLLLWQTRTGAAAQLLAIPGAVALVWLLGPKIANFRTAAARVIGISALILVAAGGAAPLLVPHLLPEKKSTPRDKAIGTANRLCNALPSFRPIARLPRGTIFSFVDYGPRIITLTHHNAVTGPYHRNGEQIGDVMRAFRGSPEQARQIIAKYRADYLLICPNSSTTTIFLAEAPKGFYGQLNRNQVPGWLQPIPLPKDSPFRMWRVAKPAPTGSSALARPQ